MRCSAHILATLNTPEDVVPRYPVRVVAERLGVPTATLRSWNQRYGVGPSAHSPGRHRLYSENDIAIVRRMHELIGQGASPRSAAQAAIAAVKPVPGDVDGLLSTAFDLDTVTTGRLLDRHLRHFGVLETWEKLVRPAFAGIERRQARGEGCIDVEHALSWTVSRALHRLPASATERPSSIILSCTEDEAHTLALEALRAALGERGHAALMLGADVPPAALMDAVTRSKPPVAAVLWSQSEQTADTGTAAAVAVHAQVVLCGPGWDAANVPSGSLLVHSLREAVRHFVPGE